MCQENQWSYNYSTELVLYLQLINEIKIKIIITIKIEIIVIQLINEIKIKIIITIKIEIIALNNYITILKMIILKQLTK